MYNTFDPEHLNFLHSKKTRKHNGTEYKDFNETVYSYEDGLLTEIKTEYDDDDNVKNELNTSITQIQQEAC